MKAVQRVVLGDHRDPLLRDGAVGGVRGMRGGAIDPVLDPFGMVARVPGREQEERVAREQRPSVPFSRHPSPDLELPVHITVEPRER